MYFESIQLKREKNSEWERGYYVGDTDNSKNSVILDVKYQPLPRDEKGFQVYDYRIDTESWIQVRCNEIVEEKTED